MQRISITNPQNIIDGTAKKYYFKLRNTGGPKGDKGEKGDTGATGPQGAKGDPCTVVVNSTATLEPGSNAYVTNTGSLSNAVLNFGIPKGDKGDTGPQGQKGERGQQGEQGPIGPQGTPGQNATVYVGTTITTNPGTQARVYNTGTENNAVLNFEIPRGAKGDTGAQGEPGPAGQNFAATVVTELPATGDSSKLYLTPKAHTTSTATGNPITATVAEEAGQMESFQLDGDTFQQSYTGKNLCRITLPGTSTVVYSNNTITLNGARGTGNLQDTSNIGTRLAAGTYTVRAFLLSGSASGNGTRFIVRIGNNAFTVRSDISGASEALSVTLDSDADVTLQIWVDEATTYDNLKIGYQIEAGSTATSYEPYVGGTPSPNPDYPQPIQTVTGEQTVEIVGKNLFDKDNMNTRNGYLYSTTFSYRTSNADRTFIVPCEPNTTYTISRSVKTSSFRAAYIDLDPSEIPADVSSETSLTCAGYIANNSGTSITITTSATAKSLLVHYGNTNTDGVALIGQSVATIMVEKSASATAYAPYSKQTLPIDLGAIELCKLGTYQDYIWKDGKDWKVHKKITKYVCDSTLNWTWDASVPRLSANSATLGLHVIGPINADTAVIGKSNKFVANSFNYVYTQKNNGFAYSQSGFISCVDKEWGSESEAKADILGSIFYFVLWNAFRTDITITETNLIAQLEAIRTASLENGANTITNTAAGSNLAGDMEIGYYGYNPTNRYDKWLWLDLNNNYEQIGS